MLNLEQINAILTYGNHKLKKIAQITLMIKLPRLTRCGGWCDSLGFVVTELIETEFLFAEDVCCGILTASVRDYFRHRCKFQFIVDGSPARSLCRHYREVGT